MSDPITLTDDEREAIADAAARAHGRGRFDPLWAAVHDLVAARLAGVTAERDRAHEHIARWLHEHAPEPDGHAGTLTGDLAVDMAAYAGRLKAENARLRDTLARVEALIADGPDTWEGYDSRDTGHTFLADSVLDFTADLRAALPGGDS